MCHVQFINYQLSFCITLYSIVYDNQRPKDALSCSEIPDLERRQYKVLRVIFTSFALYQFGIKVFCK